MVPPAAVGTGRVAGAVNSSAVRAPPGRATAAADPSSGGQAGLSVHRHEVGLEQERLVEAGGDAGGEVDGEALGGGRALRAPIEHRHRRNGLARQLE